MFDIEISGGASHRVLALRGEMDLSTAGQFRTVLKRVCADGAREVVLDLRSLNFIDTTGLRAVIVGQDFCTEHDCRYFIDPTLPRQLKRLFALTGLRGHFAFKSH
jgi:anti-anti-sigma factor